MTANTAYLVDFDGTITTSDLSSDLAAFYGGSEYMRIEQEYRTRAIPIKVWLRRIAGHLPADLDLLLNRAMQRAVMRPGFDTFLEYARDRNRPVIIASDGFGFYIEPILRAWGLLDQVNYIYRNETVQDGQTLVINNPHAHPVCQVCGNCKAAHVLALKDKKHPVIYIGDGSNDRFGASWGDHVCARDRLAVICKELNYNYSQWIDFYDIIKVPEPAISDRSATSLCCPRGNGVKETP